MKKERNDFMGEIVITSLKQFLSLVPICVLIVIVFDFLGSFFFGKK